MTRTQIKLSSFYGEAPRPYVILDDRGNPVKDRIAPPKINSALLEWASKVSFEEGGSVIKPRLDIPKVAKPGTDFQIFCKGRRADILASNPSLLTDPDEKTFKFAASALWKKLSVEERKKFKELELKEKEKASEVAPEWQALIEQQQKYRKAKSAHLRASKLQSAPLWKIQRSLNASKYVVKKKERSLRKQHLPPLKAGPPPLRRSARRSTS